MYGQSIKPSLPKPRCYGRRYILIEEELHSALLRATRASISSGKSS
jgi:hypothetical protein